MLNKKLIVLFGLLIAVVLLAGCVGQNGQSTVSAPAEDVQTGEIKEFDMTAKQWDFIPGTITVNEGDTVLLHVTSIDVAHGFALTEFGVSERLEPGQTVDIEFVADKKGTFTFFCNVVCGSGHSTMNGQLIVK